MSIPVIVEQKSPEEPIERIAVTGSRIKHDSSQMTTPTTIIDTLETVKFGMKNIGE